MMPLFVGTWEAADMLAGPWAWCLLALFFAALEALSGASFVAVFFAVGALLAAAAAALGADTALQLGGCFVLGSIASLLAVRRPLLRWAACRELGHPVDSLVGCSLHLVAALAPDQLGTGTLRGAPWQVKNVGSMPLAAGAAARVVAVDNLTLFVAAEPGHPPTVGPTPPAATAPG